MVRPLPLAHDGGARRRARPRLPLLASLPIGELGELLVRSGGTATQARAASAKVFRHIFGRTGGHLGASVDLDPSWDAATLSGLGIGAWAHPALLALDVRSSLDIEQRAPSADGTERLVLRARDGALIETVIIPGPRRTTVCISSQVGCARACTFCETGRLGLTRQLDAGEIVDQVRVARAVWATHGQSADRPPVQNVVFMGMGEPFDNLDEVARATWVLTSEPGLGISPSRVTVSTVGVADKIPAFFQRCRAELAVSLNAASDAQRSAIMPVNQRFHLAALLGAVRENLPRGHKVLFEYVLFGGFNDRPDDADALALLVSGIRCRINVIPANPGPDPALVAPSPDELDAFVARLAAHRLTTLVRKPRGRDVGGACGQLAGALRVG